MSEPSVVHRIHAVPREGGEAGDYEDAAAIRGEEWPVCAAVADGATESVFAGQWATTLVNGLADVDAMTESAVASTVADGRREWQSAVDENEQESPWYVTAKVAEGAHATALGLSVHPDGTWRAVSVGDCCLFQWREGARLRSWPFDAPDSFTNRPSLLPSQQGASVPSPTTASGTWQAGNTFALATDAVAAWLLGHRERGEDVAEVLRLDLEGFRERVKAARERGDLRNDDATLLVLKMTALPAETK
jgi:hypothetical protein